MDTTTIWNSHCSASDLIVVAMKSAYFFEIPKSIGSLLFLRQSLLANIDETLLVLLCCKYQRPWVLCHGLPLFYIGHIKISMSTKGTFLGSVYENSYGNIIGSSCFFLGFFASNLMMSVVKSVYFFFFSCAVVACAIFRSGITPYDIEYMNIIIGVQQKDYWTTLVLAHE